jgi:hypothetical protein
MRVQRGGSIGEHRHPVEVPDLLSEMTIPPGQAVPRAEQLGPAVVQEPGHGLGQEDEPGGMPRGHHDPLAAAGRQGQATAGGLDGGQDPPGVDGHGFVSEQRVGIEPRLGPDQSQDLLLVESVQPRQPELKVRFLGHQPPDLPPDVVAVV